MNVKSSAVYTLYTLLVIAFLVIAEIYLEKRWGIYFGKRWVLMIAGGVILIIDLYERWVNKRVLPFGQYLLGPVLLALGLSETYFPKFEWVFMAMLGGIMAFNIYKRSKGEESI
jgi:hypothetical protein